MLRAKRLSPTQHSRNRRQLKSENSTNRSAETTLEATRINEPSGTELREPEWKRKPNQASNMLE